MTTIKQLKPEGADTVAVTTANSTPYGTTLDGVYQTNANNILYSATQKMHGSTSIKITGNSTAGQAFVYYNGYSATTMSFLAYFYMGAVPTAAVWNFIQIKDSSQNDIAQINLDTAGKLAIQQSTSGTSYSTTSALSTATWYRVEGTVVTGTSGSLLLKVFAGDSTTAIQTINPTGINLGTATIWGARIGRENSSSRMAADFFLDDFGIRDDATLFGPTATAALTAAATSDQTGTTVTLHATATGGTGALSYVWTQTSGTTVTLSSTTVANPTWTAATAGTYGFHVVITDSLGASSSANVNVAITTQTGGSTTPTAAAIVNSSSLAIINATSSTASSGGALSFTISPSSGTSQIATGIFTVPVTSSDQVFTVTVTEAGVVNTSQASVTVPGRSGGALGIRILLASAGGFS